jgi:hypothetical protein
VIGRLQLRLALIALAQMLVLGTVARAAEPILGREDPLLERDVLPVLTKHCLGCHGGLRQFGKLDLRTLPAMLVGGESGVVIEKGQAEKSVLWQRIASDEMPEGDEREKLNEREKAIIKAWINAGVPTVAERTGKVDPLLSADQRHEPLEVAGAIDRHLDSFLAAANLTAAARSDDQEFLRRLYLDLAGRVPTAEQAVAFLDDPAPDKRAKLIDALLDSPRFGEQFGRTWRDWVCPPELPSDDNAGTQPYQQANEFGAWLGKKVVANESWDKIAREILTVQGEIKNQPQVIFYGLVGQGGRSTPDGTARAVGSLFMGVQLQCAQCHDDPYRAWAQEEHWALAAFFGSSQADFNKVETGKGPSKSPGKIEIPESAFKRQGTTVPAAFLGGKPLAEVKSDDPRGLFVDWLVDKNNSYFSRAFTNRLWFYFFARGIVNPIDDLRELNPPSHPGLLQLLANEFAASNYDVKHLVRCICLSQAYQRTSGIDPKANAKIDDQQRQALTFAFGRMPLRVMTADMLLDSLKQAYGEDKEFDLRTASKDSTTGMAAVVADAYREFHRQFGTNEEDATDFTHGVAQMLTLINHRRLLAGSKTLEGLLKTKADMTPREAIDWLYRSTLSRGPDEQEAQEALEFVQRSKDPATGYRGILWMLVNRTEFVIVR